LNDVWGDLEMGIPIPQPEKAPQPANLKLTLLPFQQESLFWMRKQEKGIWSGGMLAVYTQKIPFKTHITNIWDRMRWGTRWCPSIINHIPNIILSL
jgi:hypothetical protein